MKGPMLDRSKLRDRGNSSWQARLLEITSADDDLTVGRMIADAAMERERLPYRFSIDHDIRPPKNLACPLDYHWALKDKVGIHNGDRQWVRLWLIDAAMRGYVISEVDAKHHPCGLSWSIASARQRAEYHQRPKGADDDYIPF